MNENWANTWIRPYRPPDVTIPIWTTVLPLALRRRMLEAIFQMAENTDTLDSKPSPYYFS